MRENLVTIIGSYVVNKFPDLIKDLKNALSKSNLEIVLETFVGRLVIASTITLVISFFGLLYLFISLIKFPIIFSLPLSIIFSLVITFVTATIIYAYPLHLISSRRSGIEANLPFAINHMAAISTSGVPPFVIFKLISNVKEYGDVAKESTIVVRNMELFGMDVVSSVKSVASHTPSDQFRQFLYGFVASIETGGSLKTYLENSAKDALFDYKLKREKYLKSLETYADFYTAVMIAAPLFFVSILSVMSLVGGQIFGLDIQTAMQLGIFVMIPVINTAFLMFIHYTQPTI